MATWQNRWMFSRSSALLLLSALLVWLAPARAQTETPQTEKPLYQQTPFDQIILKSDGSKHRILPLELPGRKLVPQTTGALRVRLEDDPGVEREIQWSSIERVELYEDLVLAAANRLISQQQFSEAFRHLALLLDRYPHTANLQPAVDNYLFQSASFDVTQQRYAQALSALEELYQRNSQYVSSTGRDVVSAISAVSDLLLQQFAMAKDYMAARQMLQRLNDRYGEARLPAVAQWRSRLTMMAQQVAQQVRSLVSEGKLKEAQQRAREMLRIWPEVEGGVELAQETLRRYPIVTVGVSQRASSYDAGSATDWAARRSGRLTDRLLVEFLAPGSEGGKYVCPFGSVERSDDYRQVALQLRAPSSAGPDAIPTAHDISRRLLELATPGEPQYLPGWAEIFGNVRIAGVFRVEANLRKAHVVPEAFLQVPIAADSNDATAASDVEAGQLQPVSVAAAPAELNGDASLPAWLQLAHPYRLVEQNEDEAVYVRNAAIPSEGRTVPAEIRERYFEDTTEALAALQRGDIYALDRVFPADAARLLSDPSGQQTINVRPYALPTVHMLVPNLKNPYLDNHTFRRALLHGIPRQLILERLLDGRSLPGCRLVTGPFPAGQSPDDPIGYAYDPDLPERPFDPGMAILLSRMAASQLAQMAEKAEEPVPELRPLVLAHPEDKIARFACEIIAAQLKLLKIECQLKQLPSGQVTDPEGQYDLLYVVLTVSEPVVDAERLLGLKGLAASRSPYLGLALRRLRQASSWREARNALLEVHRLAYSEVTVIPLWQMVEHYAFNANLKGLSDPLVTLYQDVERWEIEPVLPAP